VPPVIVLSEASGRLAAAPSWGAVSAVFCAQLRCAPSGAPKLAHLPTGPRAVLLGTLAANVLLVLLGQL
jgi:hypothetical protein